MKGKSLKIVLLFTIILLLVAAFSAAAREQEPQFVEELAQPLAGSGLVIAPKGAAGDAVYMVQLQDVPLASYGGGVNGLNATSPSATGARKLDVTSSDSMAYRDYLANKQASFVASAEKVVGRSLDVMYNYDVVYNGVAMTLSPAEASAIAKQPGVAKVTRDQWRYKQTDVSPEFIDAVSTWDGSGVPGAGTKGEGVVVGVVDTGVWPEHPSFAGAGFPAPPAGVSSECEAPDDTSDPLTCNNKLVGARFRLDGYVTATGGYDGLFHSGRDDDGHGTHTASTSAGNEGVSATLLGVDRGMVSGIAPKAHVITCKGLGPGGGVTSDLVDCIDQIVADGVDVINYSIGGGATNPWGDPDSEAFLAARSAGVFVATSAGNSGPGEDTIGSPGNAPWITTVGASTSNRHFISDITLLGPGTPPSDLFGASVTAGVTNLELIDAEGIADSEGDDSGLCLNEFNPGTFTADQVVLCERGQIARVLRGDYVQAGGGGGVILYNADPAQGLSTDNYVIPAVHVVNATGLAIKEYLADNAGSVNVTFTAGQKVLAESDDRVIPDMMAAFSSRGPNGPVLDLIKPDVTAPGVQILAGASPEHTEGGAQGELFQSIQGTSMSSPHVAGAGALVKALHPDWSASEIESALMTTALTEVVKEDGSTQADAFDMGGGRIDVTKAGNAPLILHETEANYLAADPSEGGDPKDINNASMGNASCVVQCSWTRTVENVTGGEETWNASIDGVTGTVEPASFTLADGAKQTITATVSVSGLEQGVWAFGSVQLDPQTEGVQTSHLTIAVSAEPGSLPATVEINTRRNAGSHLLEDLVAVEITENTLMPYGLAMGDQSVVYLAQDETNDDAYDDLSQVWYTMHEVPDGAWRYVNEILESSAPDMDLFVGMDANGNGMPDPDEEECASTTGGSGEYCNIDTPTPGTWWVMVQNWAGSDMEMDRSLVSSAVVDDVDEGNMTLEAPGSIPALQPFDLGIRFDLEGAAAGQAWYGAFSMGSDPANPTNIGVTRVNLYRHEDDVTKTPDALVAMPGDTVEFTIHIKPNVQANDVDYTVIDMIPEGMTYVEDSAAATSGAVTVEDGKLTWTGTMPSRSSLSPSYAMTTSENDELCDTGFDGYLDLEGFDIFTQADISGDTNAWGFFGSGDPINFYGLDYDRIYMSDDGFAVFDPDNNYGGEPWFAQEFPDSDAPNNLAAILWQDMEVVYDLATNKGMSAATTGTEVMIVELDDIQLFEDPGNSYDFEMVMTRSVDDTPGAYEIVFAYDNINGTLEGPLTIGVEDAAGAASESLVNLDSADGVIDDGFMVCFDASVPQTDVTVTFEVTVDEDVNLGVIPNMATSTTSVAGSKEVTAYSGVYVGYPTFSPAFPIKN